ncbi:hypothetical protein RQP46_004427 [Phenoliferia psychrophenolica]
MSVQPPKRRTVKGAGTVRAPKKHGAPNTDGLERLSLAIEQIQLHNASQLSFEEHYRYAYNLVLHKQGHTLYNKVAELVAAHLEKETREKIVPVFPPSTSSASLASGSGSGANGGSAGAAANVAAAAAAQLFLDRVRLVWDEHMACMSKLRDVLKYMDKMYTGSNAIPSVWDLGLALFFHHVILFSTDPKPKPKQLPASSSRGASASATPAAPRVLPTADSSTVAHHLITTLLAVIRIEREGEVVSRHSIQSNVEILAELTDEGLVPLPITASVGTGSGTPVLGVGSGAGIGKNKTVMGEGPPGEQLSPYKTSFERAFLRQSQEFYARESAALLLEVDAPSFLRKIQQRLDQEATRAQAYLNQTTEPLLIKLLEETLITKHLSAILDHPASGLSTLVADSRIDDLQRLYTLFGRVPTGRPALQAGIYSWIVATGKKVNEGLLVVGADDDGEAEDPKGKGKAREGGAPKAPGAPKAKASSEGAVGAKTKAALAWVQNVLDLKDKFDVLLADAFASDKAMEKSINDAFTEFVNQNHKSPEYISLFVDENLKKGLKGKTEAEVDEVLNKTIALFRFLVEKDAFERYYNSHLAKRLIYNRSVSDDAERNMLAKFKIEAGAAFTKSAEGMMKDIKTSEDTVVEYKRYQDRNPAQRAPFDMAPIICGQNNWPVTSGDSGCTLPPILLRGIEAFKTFYDVKHSGRKLTFRTEHGTVELKAKFKARSHEITVSTHCLVVLALFEDLGQDRLSYTDIATATKMPANELRRTLQSLACAKYKILTKEPKGREVDDTDVFGFNDDFSCPLARIKIQTVANKVETAEERKETEGKVEEERRTLYEACIVRVMKDRKFLQHAELINEVTRQLAGRFKPSPPAIKQAVERLIEKEYLERDEQDRRKLKYLA